MCDDTYPKPDLSTCVPNVAQGLAPLAIIHYPFVGAIILFYRVRLNRIKSYIGEICATEMIRLLHSPTQLLVS